jgi:hypothetical protein
MTTYPPIAAGQRVTATLLRAGQWELIRKPLAESVTSSTTVQNDDDLFFAAEANAVYVVDCYLNAHQTIADGTAIDLKVQWSVPASSTGTRLCWGPTVGMTDRTNTSMVSAAHAFTSVRTYGCDISSETVAIYEHLVIETDSTAGNVQLQWAQNTSNANATVLSADSHLIVKRLG